MITYVCDYTPTDVGRRWVTELNVSEAAIQEDLRK